MSNRGNLCAAADRNLISRSRLSASEWLMSAVILYLWGNVISCTR
jgi:hypothetical protein